MGRSAACERIWHVHVLDCCGTAHMHAWGKVYLA